MNKAVILKILKYLLPAIIGSGVTLTLAEGVSLECKTMEQIK